VRERGGSRAGREQASAAGRLGSFTAVALLAAIALAACSSAGPATTPSPGSPAPATPRPMPIPTAIPTPTPAVCADPCSVGIVGVAFQPVTRHVTVGTTVTWTNRDPTTHTVTFANGQVDSLDMPPGASFHHLFDTTGTFSYRCVIHADMLGSIIVTK